MLPVAGAPLRFEASDCRNAVSLSLLVPVVPDVPDVADVVDVVDAPLCDSRASKLFSSVASVESVDVVPDVELVVESVPELDDEPSSAIRLCRSACSLPP